MEKGKKVKYLKWTEAMDRALTNVLMEQHNLGNQLSKGWKTPTYTVALKAVKDRCNVSITKANVVARLKTWDKYYDVVTDMLNTSGFGWDWNRNIVKVDSDDVWEEYVKVHPEVAHYRNKVISNWKELGTICGNDQAAEEMAQTGNEAAANPFEDENIPENFDFHKATSSSSPGGTSNSVSSHSKGSKKRKSQSEDLAAAINNVAGVIRKAFERDVQSDVQEVFGALYKISGLEESELFDAYDLLVAEGRKFAQLQSLPDHMKKGWLMHQLKK